MELYEAIFLIILAPFAVLVLAIWCAAMCVAFNAARLIVQAARGKI